MYQMMITFFIMICHITQVDKMASPINIFMQLVCPLVPILALCLFRGINLHKTSTYSSLPPSHSPPLLYHVSIISARSVDLGMSRIQNNATHNPLTQQTKPILPTPPLKRLIITSPTQNFLQSKLIFLILKQQLT